MIKWKGSLPPNDDFYNKTKQSRKKWGSSPSCCSKLYIFLETQNKIFFNETSLVLISFDAFEPMKFVLACQANMVELVFTICDPGPQTQS